MMKPTSIPLTPSLIGIKIEKSFFHNLKGFVIVAEYDNEQQKVFYAKNAEDATKIVTKSIGKMDSEEETPAPPAPPREEEEEVLG